MCHTPTYTHTQHVTGSVLPQTKRKNREYAKRDRVQRMGGGGVRMNAGRAPVWDDERGVGGAIDRAVDLVCLLLSTGVCLVVDVKST